MQQLDGQGHRVTTTSREEGFEALTREGFQSQLLKTGQAATRPSPAHHVPDTWERGRPHKDPRISGISLWTQQSVQTVALFSCGSHHARLAALLMFMLELKGEFFFFCLHSKTVKILYWVQAFRFPRCKELWHWVVVMTI